MASKSSNLANLSILTWIYEMMNWSKRWISGLIASTSQYSTNSFLLNWISEMMNLSRRWISGLTASTPQNLTKLSLLTWISKIMNSLFSKSNSFSILNLLSKIIHWSHWISSAIRNSNSFSNLTWISEMMNWSKRWISGWTASTPRYSTYVANPENKHFLCNWQYSTASKQVKTREKMARTV